MGPASLVVLDPNGRRTQIGIEPVPFQIGRLAGNQLVLRDSRASRKHARIVIEAGEYVVEDTGSRHGVFVNGKRVQRQTLRNSDRIEFGVPDSYSMIFLRGALGSLLEEFAGNGAGKPVLAGAGSNLAKLRAVLEVARALESSLSIEEVLGALVDAALAVTGAERGFLLLRRDEDLEIRVARSQSGAPLAETDLRIPRRLLHRALKQRRELLSMNFDPLGEAGVSAGHSVADLELRSVVCVPLVRIQMAAGQDTSALSADRDTVGVLYMDSRGITADLSGGNRELLQTLAIEASTVLENARLLEEERIKHKIEEELNVARAIQQSLLPRELPEDGWFRACGSSEPSHQVGGDYFDVVRVGDGRWAAVVADVSGKGVSAALLASLLQGAFVGMSSDNIDAIEPGMCRINRFLIERTEGGKYATAFFCVLDRDGRLHYINAGHCPPLVISTHAQSEYLDATATPLGLLENVVFQARRRQLAPGDRIVVYTDGITEAQNESGEFFGRKRLREIALREAATGCADLNTVVKLEVASFTGSAEQSDDMTLLVLEYRP